MCCRTYTQAFVSLFSAGEAVVAELAPELVPMLSALEMPANFVPVTNAVLSEMQRRGVARDQLLTALRRMGEDMPCAAVAMLQVAAPWTLHPQQGLHMLSVLELRHSGSDWAQGKLAQQANPLRCSAMVQAEQLRPACTLTALLNG